MAEGYPEQLTYLRHAKSRYNARHEQSRELPSQKEFTEQFDKEYFVEGDPSQGVRQDLDIEYYEGKWPSPKLKALAVAYYRDMQLIMGKVSDPNTPLADEGFSQAEQTGVRLPEVMERPDIIYCSPYLRTRQTLERILSTAPRDWSSIRKKEYEPLREQEYGIQTLHSDWRLTFVLHPEEMLQYLHDGPYAYRPSHGESKHDARNRASRFIGNIYRKHADERVLAVTHHLTILSNLAELQSWTREQFIEWDERRRPPNCSVTVLNKAKQRSPSGRDYLLFDEQKYGMKLYE